MNHELIPINLDKFIINKDIADKLKNINKDNMVHTLFYGKCNSGKKTLMKALINNIFNTNIDETACLSNVELKIGNNKVNIEYILSKYHLEINLYEYGLYDKNIITDFLEEHVKYNNINYNCKKYIIIHHLENSSISAQRCLRKLLETYYSNSVFIFISEEITKIEKGLLSRLMKIRVPSPSTKEITHYIDYLSKTYHKISILNKKALVKHGKNDLFIITKAYIDLKNNKKIDLTKLDIIDEKIKEIIQLVNKPNIKSIIEIRKLSYDLLLININTKYILKRLLNYYMNSDILTDSSKFKLVDFSSTIQHKQSKIEHDIICLEFFILKVKKLLLNN
tara:strand:- start:2152 stop:3159 length:1008 start_codon:yes stop_codon:yes gene_type:complete